jgi:transposase
MSHDEQAAALKHEDIVALLVSHEQVMAKCEELASYNDDLKRKIEWLQRQIFGEKSERRPVESDPRQLTLGEWHEGAAPAPAEVTVAEHRRRVRSSNDEEGDDEGQLRFDDALPVEEIRLPHPPLDDDHEIVSEKITYRLAQRPASYVLLKFVRPVVKRKSDATLSCPLAPPAVLGKSLADVSLLACMLIDKFTYHLPLYRQHQRMEAAGIHLARSTLTGLVHRSVDLLEPIYDAQLASILRSRVLAMDETPIKAGLKGPRKMKTCYFWPIYGERGEVVFPFAETRSGSVVRELLAGFSGTLLSDGYIAYENFVKQVGTVEHAQCWSHTRRQFLKAEDVEPELTKAALDQIRELYAIEAQIRPKMVEPEKRLELRALNSKPIVDKFFDWLETTLVERLLLPRNPFTEAAEYALTRKKELKVFLADPEVAIDTNHLERQIRPIALGRRNWLFCWTEVGAKYVGIVQSLLATCRLQGLDPYTYLVDVLQRVDAHPAHAVADLTPRIWKDRFGAVPLKSAIDRVNAVP